MVQQGRSQLQMTLLQQSGPGSLPLSNLKPDDFLGFLRRIEQLIIDERLSPVLVYWSSQQAKRLLPSNQRYRELMRDCFCISVFSEERPEPPDEWCFVLESRQFCLFVYGRQSPDATAGNEFQCAGSVDPQIVRQACAMMQPIWQYIDLPETTRSEDARRNLGPVSTTTQLAERCRVEWPIIKPPASVGQSFQSTSAPGPGVRPFDPSLQSALAGGVPVPAPVPSHDIGPQPLVTGPGPLPFTSPVPAPGPAAAGGIEPVNKFRGFAGSPLTAPGTLVQPGAGQPVPGQPAEKDSSRSVIPQAAQEIIREIIGKLRHSKDQSSILQLAIEKLTQVGKAHRGLIWQLAGDQLQVVNEYSISGHNCFVGNQLGPEECTAMTIEFLSRFPDESGAGVISVPDTMQDSKLHKMAPTLASLIELGEVRARLVAQLRCRGLFSGFLELQQCKQPRQWSEEDAAVLQSVAEMLSVVVQQSRDQSKIETDAQEMKLINEIANLFRESKGEKGHDMLVRSLQLVADHLGFVHSQIYLYSQDQAVLEPQLTDGQHAPVDLSAKENPFVQVYESGRVKPINVEYTRKGDPFFGHDTALVVPLLSEGERLGVLGLWERRPNQPQLRPQDNDLALTVAGQLASTIRADQAITQIRAEQRREALINRVSEEIRESLKEVDHIMETLVQCLQEYFGLDLCVVALFDNQAQDFTKSKTAGPLAPSENEPAPNFGEKLFLNMITELKQGQTIPLIGDDLKRRFAQQNILPPQEIGLATLVPLVHAGNFKAALCMVSRERNRPFPEKDMRMVSDLADRVAVVVSHAELFAQVERQAVTDPMTGLYNRRHFGEQLSKEIDRFQRFGHAFSYIIVDLDFLKKINDSLGHQFGDVAIKHIAQVLKKSVRDVDTAARYGGEEFVVLLPETDVKRARVAAERICASIREEPVEGIGTITASVGTSTYPDDADDRDKLTELADQALYLAKHRGRNQVCSVSEDLKPSLEQRGEEALEVQKAAIKHKAEEMASIDLKLVAEHGILGIMGAIIKIIEARDEYNNERSPKAAEYATKMAQALHLSKDHVTVISLAAILHNVGKLSLPQEILQKRGPLTPEERKLVEQSPSLGAKFLEPAKNLHRVATVIEAYHEHYDGSGYPKGLKGEEIPLESRIIALVDAYIAMTSDRPYRKAMSHEEAVKLIQAGASKDWDPRLVKLFLSILQKSQAEARSGA